MDTINILQKTYEELYVARIPLRNFLLERLPIIDSQWKRNCVERVLEKNSNLTISQKENQNRHRKDFSQLDVYFLIQIILDEQNWKNLQTFFPNETYYYIKENRDLYYDVREIRCNVMHPTFEEYTFDDFKNWGKKIYSFVSVFSPDKTLEQYIKEFHQEQKDKLFNKIYSEVIGPALNCEKLSEETKLNIKNTKERLEIQENAAGIYAFYKDALCSIQGKEIASELERNKLKSFEKIRADVERLYFS